MVSLKLDFILIFPASPITEPKSISARCAEPTTCFSTNPNSAGVLPNALLAVEFQVRISLSVKLVVSSDTAN